MCCFSLLCRLASFFFSFSVTYVLYSGRVEPSSWLLHSLPVRWPSFLSNLLGSHPSVFVRCARFSPCFVGVRSSPAVVGSVVWHSRDFPHDWVASVPLLRWLVAPFGIRAVFPMIGWRSFLSCGGWWQRRLALVVVHTGTPMINDHRSWRPPPYCRDRHPLLFFLPFTRHLYYCCTAVRVLVLSRDILLVFAVV